MKRIAAYLLLFLNALSAFEIFPKQTEECDWIKDYLIKIPDFPKQGVTFISFAPLLEDPVVFDRVVQTFVERYKNRDLDAIAGIDSRGFIFGAVLAHELKKPFIMIRKKGKLPRVVERLEYELEHGSNTIEIEVESLRQGEKILIIDDIVATGGTVKAAADLVKKMGAEVAEIACLIEISSLKGREKVDHSIYSLLALE